MAYDKAKAHEYYEKYRKRGLLKGRKKANDKKTTKKTTKKKGKAKKAAKAKQENLVGLSTSGLNDKGRMQAAMIKENIKAEMNQALSKAKTPEEKAAVRMEYQNKALEEITKLKSNPDTAQAKKQTKAKSTSSKSSSSKSSSSSSKSSSGSTSESSKSTSAAAAKEAARAAAVEAVTKQAQEQIDQIVERVKNMTEEEKAAAKLKIEDVIKEIEQIQTNLAATTTAITAAIK